MRRAWLACGAVLLALGAALWVARSVPAPQDRPAALSLPAGRPLRITLLGTSLSHGEIWPDSLRRALQARLNQPVDLSIMARPGAGSRWGRDQARRAAERAPDWVLIEFAINDADIRDGQSLAGARRSHAALVQDLRALQPQADIVLLTMSPAQGLRGLLRPRLGAHYRQYRELAATLDLGLVDLYPRWRALPGATRGLQADGLHPDPQTAADLIVPVLTDYLLRNAGREPSR